MGCGFSGAGSAINPQKQGFKMPQVPGVNQADIEATMKEKANEQLEKAGDKAVEKFVEKGSEMISKEEELDLQPATNIQFEVPPAFKHITPLVPKNHPKISALEAVQHDIEFSDVTYVTSISKSTFNGSSIHLEGLDESTGQGKIYELDGNFKTVSTVTQKNCCFGTLTHTDGKKFWYQKDGAYLQDKSGKLHTLRGKAYSRPAIMPQFWGDYLFFVSDNYLFFRVSINTDGSYLQENVTGSSEPTFCFEVMPDGKLFAIDKDGQLRDGVNIPSTVSASLKQYQFSKSLNLTTFGMPDGLFYIFKRISNDLLFASADDPDNGILTVALVTRKLELLHMINLKLSAGHTLGRRIGYIREDTWKGYPLIISAREIFEIDLFLIAKNQIMHLQTIASFATQSDSIVMELFRCLEKVGSDWYIGGSNVASVLVDQKNKKFEDFPLLRKIKWAQI